MRLTQFKVLSFGCYGTLIDRDAGVHAALRPLLTLGQVTLSRREVLQKFADYESRQQTETPKMPYSDVLFNVHKRLAGDWCVNASDDDHALFGKSVPNWPVYAEAPAALQYLKRYFKLAVLSNVDRHNLAGSQRRLEIMFDAIFTAQEIGACKPAAGNFEHMVSRLAKFEATRRQVLHTAHSLVRDRAPAVACGLAFAWIDRPTQNADGRTASASAADAQYDLRFSSLVDLVRAHQEQLQA
jgi:2-haloacid dehalogenase